MITKQENSNRPQKNEIKNEKQTTTATTKTITMMLITSIITPGPARMSGKLRWSSFLLPLSPPLAFSTNSS